MATTVTSPNYWTLTLTTSTTGKFNFKFVVDITIGGVVVARIKQPKNLNGSAHLSFERIVKNYINISHKHDNSITGIQYDSIHTMPQNVPNPTSGVFNDYIASKNSGDLRVVLFEFYEEYASTDGGVITVNPSGAADITKALINYANSWEDQKIFDNTKFEFNTTDALAKFITDRPTATTNPNSLNGNIAQLTSANDYQTMVFFNDLQLFDVDYGRFLYRFYEEPPTTLGFNDNYVGVISAENSDKIGSLAPNLPDTEDEYLMYLACGGANVMNMKYIEWGNYQPTASIKYYSIQYVGTTELTPTAKTTPNIKAGDYAEITIVGTQNWTLIGSADNVIGTRFYATGAGTGTGACEVIEYNKLSEPYIFEMISDANCNSSKYEGKNIAWKNKYGVWDYYFFDGATSDKENYRRKTQRENVAGSWNAAAFTIDTFERGKVDNIEGSKLTTINTRYISEDWNEHFKGLLMSNEVQIIENGKSYPINIKNTSFDIKTNVKDKLVQYTFAYEYAHDLKSIV